MTPTEAGSPTLHVTTSEEKTRAFIDLLLDDGDQAALIDALAIDTDTDDIDDVTGWGCSVSLPRPPLHETRRAVPNPAAPPASSTVGGGGLRRKSYKQSNAPDMDLSNMRVRCVNEDFAAGGDHQKSHWKANVEPGTYRYISNNGFYRSTKFANTGSDWVTAKRTRHIDNNHANNNTANPEVKHAQKTLRKDLDQHFRLAENMKNENTNLPPSTPGHKSRDPRLHNHHQQHQENNTTISKNSSSSGNNINNNNNNNNISKSDSDSLPPPSRPPPPKDPKLVKSASDLFVENFSSRLTALEKSEKETNANTPVPRTRTPCSPHKSNPTKHHHNNHNHYHSDTSADDISKDVFTVRPVTRAPDLPLGPLEKLTPQQKLLEKGTDSECSSQQQSKSQPESPSLPPSFMTAMNAFSQLHNKSTIHQHNHRNKDSNKNLSRSNPNTHRHPYKSNSMSNVSDTDTSINSVRNALTLTNSNIERMRMGSYGKSPIKDYGRFLSSTRPKMAAQQTSAFGRTIGNSNSNVNNNNNNNNNNHANNGFTGSGGLTGSNIHKNSIVGYKSLSTSAPVTHGSSMRPPQSLIGTGSKTNNNNNNYNDNTSNTHSVVASTLQVDDVSTCGISETESYLSGTSLSVNRGSGSLKEGKGGGGGLMQLPGISGKRMAVATTTQRML